MGLDTRGKVRWEKSQQFTSERYFNAIMNMLFEICILICKKINIIKKFYSSVGFVLCQENVIPMIKEMT